MVLLKRETGALEPMRQGHGGHGKLKAHAAWILQRVTENGDLTLNELCIELAGRGVTIQRSNVSLLLHRLGLSLKKTLQASEQNRLYVKKQRDLWINRRRRFFNKALSRLVFIDETSTNTKLIKRSGWAPKGQLYRAHAPFGSWKTQTFISGLRCDGLVAPWIVDGAMDGAAFDAYVRTQLAPSLIRGDDATWRAVGDICNIFHP